MDDDSKRTNGGATTGDAPEQQEKASGHGSQVNGAASTAEDAAGEVASESATTDASKKRSQPFGSRLSFGQKQKSEPKARTVDEVRVADGALASIIGLAAHEVPGVVGMAPASITEGIRRILGSRQVDEGVVIARGEQDDAADVDIYVVVAYGVNIPVVADSVRERVRYAAKTYAGVELTKVRVRVAGVSRA